MRFRIVCGLVLLLAHAAPGAQETVPERVMTFSGKGGSAFADFTLEEGEAALIQFLDEAGQVLHPLSIKVEDNGDSYIAGRVSPGARLDFLPKRNPVSVPLFDLFGLQDMKLRLLVKANAGRGAATIAASTETDIAVVHLAGELAGEMVEIPGGTFRMGDLSANSVGSSDELPVHGVTVPSFRMGKHEVTFSQWDACVADGGCSYSPGDSGFGRGNRPVINVSWDDIQEFIVWLNARTGGGYRLPTESEWEYAARAGSESLYTWGDEIGVNRANCRGCGGQWDARDRTAPVGSFPANAWGLHDVHGNVWEWVEDCVNNSYEGAPDDGSAWLSGTCSGRVIRGGSWGRDPGQLRSSNRTGSNRSDRSVGLGFRLASIDVARQVAELEEEMVEIPGGTFRMGDLSGDDRASEIPVHSVTVPSFWMGKHEVTFSQWDACVADGGCSRRPDDEGFGRANRPVIRVSWHDVQEFIVWLNARTDGGYRLPTESEWEYAARARSESLYTWGDEIGVNRANCVRSFCGDQWDGTAPVGSFPANAWGLHDMHGNVIEWVEDCPSDDNNYEGAPADGSAWLSGSCGLRVVRGGSWFYRPGDLRSSLRGRFGRSGSSSYLGFRVARDRDTNTEIAIDVVVADLEEEMVEIPGGTFRMGDLGGDERAQELPVHSVTVPSFWMGKHEVTFSQWDACVADGGCSHSPGDSGSGRGNRPVIGVSWHDIQEFIVWLRTRTGGGYRLPTESEWEYAARAGSESEYTWGDEIGVNRANCRGCGSQWDDDRTAPVGSFPANVWGLHDIHGNVWEWTEDCVNYDGYEGAPSDGSAWLSGHCSERVIRGGSWNNFPGLLRSSFRLRDTRSIRSSLLGFRLARIDVARLIAELAEKERRLAGEMVEIPGGTFRMGDLGGDERASELPVHSVTVPSFLMGKHEVTFSQWDACVADGGCSRRPDDEGFGRGNRPVINVSWDDIQEFIAWLNARTGGGYRLPTESEWEYVARAGTESEYTWGDELGVNRANCDGCGSEWDNTETAPVGSFPANAWGLHDVHGNVWERVEDCWNGSYEGAPGDGSAWLSGTCSQRVGRGGSWFNNPWFLRSSFRFRFNRSFRYFNLGFRLARDR